MTREEFWILIETAREGALQPDEVAWRLQRTLERAGAQVTYEFLQQQGKLVEESYSWDLWGAAYVINEGCSDDGFQYFRGWLMAQGRETFESALLNPDSLAEVDVEANDAFCEDILASAARAYKKLTGALPKGPRVQLPSLGEGWDFDDPDEMSRRYPRLFAKYARWADYDRQSYA